MKISIRSFLGKLYRLNYDLAPWNPFGMPEFTDLCHFIRVVFLWLPFKIGLVAVSIAAGWVWWEVSAIIGGTIGMTLLLIGLVLVICDKLWPRLRELGDVESVSIVTQYLKAKKAKICPFIEITGE